MIGTRTFWSPALATPTSSAPDVQERLSDFPNWSLATWLHWLLRIAMLWCFVGHGAFGIIGKAGWLPYYHVFGIGDSFARDTMPLIGAVDIAVGIVTLFRPMRAVLLYGIFWTALTAFLRPLAGQGLWQEVAERGGNIGIPLALLLLVGVGSRDVRSWFEYARPRPVTVDLAKVLSWTLRICIALLLIGHGGFGITNLHHQEWVGYLGALGFSPETVESMNLIPLVAWFEVALGVAVLVKPARGLIIGIFVWKLGFELLRPLAGEPMWEFIERGGDYFLPIALLLVQGALARRDTAETVYVSQLQQAQRQPQPMAWTKPYVAPAAGVLTAQWVAAGQVRVNVNVNGHVNGHVKGHVNGHVNGNGHGSHAAPVAPGTTVPAPPEDEELMRAAAALAARFGRKTVGAP